MVKAFYAFVAVALALNSGCELFDTKDFLSPIMPDTDSAVLREYPPVEWRLRWLSGPSEVSSRLVYPEEQVHIPVAREIPLILSAVPESAGSTLHWSAKAAGYVRGMEQIRKDAVVLNWESGFAAELLLDLAEGGMNLLELNVQRLADEIADRCGDRPWDTDRRHLIEEIAEGSLWVYSIRYADVHECHLSLPEGLWYPAYIPDTPLNAAVDGWQGSLSSGFHCFLSLRNRQVASVWVDEVFPTAFILSELPR